jgi:bifunctional UDP-N-acetylglucosamine pyrophosphorylase/glucosamine-1-phosphate N-acetyltransferase
MRRPVKKSFVSVVLAAGKGTRFKSSRPKVMHEILGKPLLYYPVSLALEAGASGVICVVEKDATEVREYLASAFAGLPVTCAVQDERLGTAHALWCARGGIPKGTSKILVLYGADPMMTRDTIRDLKAKGGRSALALTTAVLGNPSGYGRVLRDRKGKVAGIVEQRDADETQKAVNEINVGIYYMDASLMDNLLRKVGNSNAQGEYYLTDLVKWAVRRGLAVESVRISDEGELVGVNDRAELAICAREMSRRINSVHMKNGVTIVAPECTWIGPEVTMGADTVVMPGCVILGKTDIGSSTVLEAHSVIRDCRIGNGAHIREFCHLDSSEAGDGTIVGPFARMRPGSVMAAGSHIGNFVELKKTRLGPGSKANHLTYLGDAEIGSDVNVGAGTITCNYDGIGKFKTVLEDGVFVGSDTQFVAPVTVGAGAYIGAGSTITRDVPADALAVSRVPQHVIPGGGRAKRERKRQK